MKLLARSLDDFAPTSWHVIADTLVDGGATAPLPDLVAAVLRHAKEGDLRRADAWLGDGDGDLDAGAQLLTQKIIDELHDRGIVDVDQDTVTFARSYLDAHELPGGGVRLVLPGRGWRTYDALPGPDRRARHDRDTFRENTSAAIRHASQYRREIKTPEQRSGPRQKTARMAADDLLESLRAFGYLPSFPITINSQGEVVEGNHRLKYAELARATLVAERERLNGADPITAADLDRRINSLERDEILRHARQLDGSPGDALRITIAAQIQIPWDAYERKAIASRLSLDGLDVVAIAQMLGASERSVREWTQETRAANADIERAAQVTEAQRLRALGLSNRQVADRLGVSHHTVADWLNDVGSDGGDATTAQRSQAGISDELLTAEADIWVAGPNGSQKAFAAYLRDKHGVGVHTRRAAPAIAVARDRAAVLGTTPGSAEPESNEPDVNEPEIAPAQTCPTCGGTGQI